MHPSSVTAASATPGLRIGGWEKLSAVDFPGRLAAVVFCQGCAWRCGYCHNPHLLAFAPSSAPTAGWGEILRWLERRRGLLDAVVFSGGEATLQAGLGAALRDVRALGFEAGLHTGGPSPARLAAVLPELDWVGFDVKAPFDAYETVTRHRQGAHARESLRLLLASGVANEVRTTWHPALLPPAALRVMADSLVAEGVTDWVIQRFRSDGCLDATLARLPREEPPLALLERLTLRITVR